MDPVQQLVPLGGDPAKFQCHPHRGLPLSIGRGVAGLLQRARGGKHQGQLRHHLRAPRRDDGQRVPADHGGEDPPRVHQDAVAPARRGAAAAPDRSDQRRLLALGGHQAQEERDLLGRGGEAEPPRVRERLRAALGDPGGPEDEVLPLRHAGAEARPQRQAPVRGHRPARGQGQVRGDGGHQVPPVRQVGSLRERPHDLLHPARRRVRAHELQAEHPREALDLGGSGRRPRALQVAHRVHDQGQVAVQVAQRREQRGDPHSRALGRGLAVLQDVHRHRALHPRPGLHRLEHQAVPGPEGLHHDGQLRPALRRGREQGRVHEGADLREV
mmetsp:Transcript_81380/g.252576  ORF Transcript_81380/g.252576 Transcript_81380/m.252576 type:complete len:328 (+) Transcript_81380:241-1224(+)